MAKTYVPGLKLAIATLSRYIGKWKPKFQNKTSQILFAIAEFLLTLCTIAISIMELQENSDGQYDPSIPVNNSEYINQVTGAYNQFMASLGAEVGS